MLGELRTTFFHLRLVVVAFVINALYLANQIEVVIKGADDENLRSE